MPSDNDANTPTEFEEKIRLQLEDIVFNGLEAFGNWVKRLTPSNDDNVNL